MGQPGRWVGIGSALAIVAAGIAVASGQARPTQVSSPCGSLVRLATWSPNGKQIAYVSRLSRPPGQRRISRAICVSDTDGRDAKPLRYAACRGRCDLINDPSELFWQRPKRLLIGNTFGGIFSVSLEGRPRLVGSSADENGAFTVDAAGDRLAYGRPGCGICFGSVTVLSVPSGATVGEAGAPTNDNFWPSLSPDGKRVVFVAATQTSSTVWTASVSGTNLQPLPRCGGQPLWSPTGNWIACPGAGAMSSALILVSPETGRSTTLIPPVGASDGVHTGHIFGWSPNGKRIALLYGRCACRIEVVDLATHKMRQVLVAHLVTDVAWSPDSRQLLVTEHSPIGTNCYLLLRLSISGTKPRHLRSCS